MADERQAELSLASLRRRGGKKRPAYTSSGQGQTDLFTLFQELASFPTPSTATPEAVPEHSPRRASPEIVVTDRLDTPDHSLEAAGAGGTPLLAARASIPPETSDLPAGPLPRPAKFPPPSSEPEAPPRRWTVSGLVRHVRGLVEEGFARVTVEGEISNWRPAGSGHCYFTLKDNEAQLSAVIFRRQASLVRFRPRDGDAVRLHGQLSIYESRGQMQIIVEWMEQIGFGAVLAALQRLKERLRGEGLFDRKRPLPPFPRCIGVVTSLGGAALRDIVKVCRRRHAAVQLLIYPAAVQGPNCAAEIAAGLRWFSAHPERAEVVLVARGGGSWEDLHGFDDEGVVRAIAGSTLPVITGLGHATDSTLADLAADLCAPTPSAAAELLTTAQHRVEERVERLDGRLRRAGSFEILRAQQKLSQLGAANVLRRVEDGLNRRAQQLDELGFRRAAAQRARLARAEARLQTLAHRLGQGSPAAQLTRVGGRLETLSQRLVAAAAQRTAEQANRLERGINHLQAMSPLRVLERGYALVYGPDGRLLRSTTKVRPGEQITARVAEGTLTARVTG